MNVLIGAPSSIPTPSAGSVNLFLNSDDNNRLYYKDENGEVFLLADTTTDNDACCCHAGTELLSKLGDALKCGMISSSAFSSIISAGINISGTSSVDPVTGAKTCSFTISNPSLAAAPREGVTITEPVVLG